MQQDQQHSGGVCVSLPDPEATDRFGGLLARALGDEALVIGLNGELGSGKTALARAVLRARGIRGRVRSPTYTLIEAYDTSPRPSYHLDLYRLADPSELDYLGVRDLIGSALVLVEWPCRGGDDLAARDIEIHLHEAGVGRCLEACAGSEAGRTVLGRLTSLLAAGFWPTH